jgi:DNA topoisomerase VI subunit B
MARLGKPAVALVTTDFWAQGNFVATAAGMPEIPRVQLPHPIAGTEHDYMRVVAETLVPEIVSALTTSASKLSTTSVSKS